MVMRALPASGSPGGGPLHGYELGRDGLDRIIGLYDLLGSVVANPVVALNGAVAITERDGPEHGLAVLEAIVGMERSHLWHAALADNLQRFGRAAEAAGALETAAALAPTEGERRLLLSGLLDVRPEAA
jgi:predicted RNA polymerase sigma factor